MEIDLRVSYIWVEGRLDIGSEECPYEGKTTITLTGKPTVFFLSFILFFRKKKSNFWHNSGAVAPITQPSKFLLSRYTA